VNAALAQREVALAGVALLAAITALALAQSELTGAASPRLPKPVPAPGGGWYEALAAAEGESFGGRRTACGHRLTRRSIGVAHPVLPCGAKLFISYGDKMVLTQVIDRGPFVPGREFDFTRELARRVGLRGTQPIRWRFARAG
jgi:rare lipoprotein A (peptidoglycan hydrolase)